MKISENKNIANKMAFTAVKFYLTITEGLPHLSSPSLFSLQVIVAGHLFLQM